MREEQTNRPCEVYKITLKGILDDKWSDWFDGFDITHTSQHETILRGPVVDQGALHGLLARVRDLGLSLISVERLSGENNFGDETNSTSKN